ncbi:MAG TPA: ROK family transcriptional regulator [Rhizobiaceae bacterium]|nr:ROK family transcriptional regulator [Rhizobiaceae bacterium]
MRDFNQRLVLSLVRRRGSLSKTDIARITGLSTQTISVIMRELELDGLLQREAPVRGKVGQPSIPMSLNPNGAYFFGLKIGRRSATLVLIDFVGTVLAMHNLLYPFPTPEKTISFVRRGIAGIRASLAAEQDRRLAGLGIAMPFELWNWADSIGAAPGAMDVWREIDIRAQIASDLPFPVYLQNDATSACCAELVFGETGGISDFVYYYIGAFAGGGVVLNQSLYGGRTGNAGALGSMPVPGPDGRPAQLIDLASIARLEKMLSRSERQPIDLWTSPSEWGDLGDALEIWIESSGKALAYATLAASAVIDFEAAVIDGWMPADVRRRLVEAVRAEIVTLDSEGIRLPEIREGTVGHHARALGGASLPLSDRFLTGPAVSSKAS